MKRVSLSTLLFLALILTGVSRAAESRADGCVGPFGSVSACTGNGKVSLSGTAKGKTSSSKKSYVPAPAPVGATQLVACGGDAAGELTGLGDPQAADDAGFCGTWVFQCKQAAPGATSASIRVQKQTNGTWTLNGSVCTKPAKPVITAEIVRDRVVRLVPSAKLGLAPHDSTLVNIQTIMWVDAPMTQQLPPISILGQNVTVGLTLSRVEWDFGDRQSAISTTAGKAYDNAHDPCRTALCPHYFGHVYRISGTQTIHATATWTASFAVGGGRPTTIPGTVDGPTATDSVTVKQARAVLIPNPGDR